MRCQGVVGALDQILEVTQLLRTDTASIFRFEIKRLKHIFQHMFRHLDFVAIAQQAFLDAFAVDLGAVGTVQVFQKGIVADRNDHGMTAADCIVSPTADRCQVCARS